MKPYIPKLDKFLDSPNDKMLKDDYIDLKLSVIDNGDEKCLVEMQMNSDQKINLVCNMFLPIEKETTLMVGATGYAAYLRTLSVK